MRVAWILVLAAWLAGYSPGVVAAAHVSPGSDSGRLPTDASLFHDGEFTYVPTPTQEPDNPLFHRGSFKIPAGTAADSDEPVRATEATVVSPTPISAVSSPPATPTPIVTSRAAVATPTAIERPTITPTPFFLGAEPDPRFYAGGFYLPPLTPNPIDEPDHYRGSVGEVPGSLGGETSMDDSGLPMVPYGRFAERGPEDVKRGDVLRPTYYEQSPLPAQGRAMYYNPGIMAAVYAYRLQNKQVAPCAECVGYVALLRAGDLNRKIWLRWEDGQVEGPFLVIDVAASHHIPLLLSRNWVVDVDYQTALRHKMNRPVPVTVLASFPYVMADSPDIQFDVLFRR